MTRGRIALTGSLALAAGLVFAPAVATAGGSLGKVPGRAVIQGRPAGAQQGGVHKGRVEQSSAGVRTVAPQPQLAVPQHVAPYPIARSVVPSGAIAASFVYVYTPPLVYGSAVLHDAVPYDAPVAYAPAVSYAPASAYAPPPVSYGPSDAIAAVPSPPPPTPSVVEYPTGRYELRGDGIAMPHAWVWIPNPPPAPPTAPPPSQASDPDDQAVPRRQQLFRWTDASGVAYWTDRLDAVPQQYRAEAEP